MVERLVLTNLHGGFLLYSRRYSKPTRRAAGHGKKNSDDAYQLAAYLFAVYTHASAVLGPGGGGGGGCGKQPALRVFDAGSTATIHFAVHDDNGDDGDAGGGARVLCAVFGDPRIISVAFGCSLAESALARFIEIHGSKLRVNRSSNVVAGSSVGDYNNFTCVLRRDVFAAALHRTLSEVCRRCAATSAEEAGFMSEVPWMMLILLNEEERCNDDLCLVDALRGMADFTKKRGCNDSGSNPGGGGDGGGHFSDGDRPRLFDSTTCRFPFREEEERNGSLRGFFGRLRRQRRRRSVDKSATAPLPNPPPHHFVSMNEGDISLTADAAKALAALSRCAAESMRSAGLHNSNIMEGPFTGACFQLAAPPSRGGERWRWVTVVRCGGGVALALPSETAQSIRIVTRALARVLPALGSDYPSDFAAFVEFVVPQLCCRG